jgi:hypothetical protein
MTRAAILLALSAFPALADEDWPSPEIIAVERAGNPCVTVVLDNKLTRWSWRDFTLPTSHGPITVRQHATPNDDPPCCADTLEAIDWPQGLTPLSTLIVVEEGQVGRIEFMCWEGM